MAKYRKEPGRKLSWIEERESEYTPNSPKLADMAENADFGPAGVVGSVARKGPRIWKAASAAVGEGGLVKEGRGIWNKIKAKMPGASDDDVAKAASNYADMWTGAAKSDKLIDDAVAAVKGNTTKRSLRKEGKNIVDEVELLSPGVESKLNKLKKPEATQTAAAKAIEEARSMRARGIGNNTAKGTKDFQKIESKQSGLLDKVKLSGDKAKTAEAVRKGEDIAEKGTGRYIDQIEKSHPDRWSEILDDLGVDPKNAGMVAKAKAKISEELKNYTDIDNWASDRLGWDSFLER